MKYLFLLVTTLLTFSTTFAQQPNKWEIRKNNKILFKGTSDDEGTIKLKRRSIRNADRFTFSYKTFQSDNTWNRTFLITNEDDQELKRYTMKNQSGIVTIKGQNLRPFLKQKQTILVYTSSLPKDPAKAATIRVGRTLVAKVELD